MNVKELLERLPDPAIAIFKQQDVIAGSLNEGITLGEAYTTRRILSELLLTMREWEKKTLKRIVISFGSRPFDASALEKASRYDALSGAEVRLGLLQLRRRGILFALSKSWGETLLLLPEDSFAIWQSLLCDDGIEMPAASESADPENGGYFGIAWNLLLLLRYCSEFEVTLTGKGTIAKQHLAGLLKRLTIKEEQLRPFGLSYEHESFYPAHIAVLLETAFRLGLLYIDNKTLTVNRQAVAFMLGESNERVHTMLYRCWRGIYRPEALWLEHALVWLERRKAGAMHTVSVLRSWLSDNRIVPAAEEDAAWEHLDGWLEAMADLGWLELFAEPDGGMGIVTRVSGGATARNAYADSDDGTKAGKEPERMLYVQPDFELLVPSGASYADIWQLTAISETIRVDRNIGVLKLTKDRLLQAQQLGIVSDMQESLFFLRSRAYYGLPDNVESTLLQWASQQADSDEKKLHYTKTMKNNVSLVLSASPENFILESEAVQCGSFLFHKEPSVFNVDSSLPDPNEFVPDIRRIPAMWVKQYRPYHASTCKELLRQAMEWKTYVRMDVEGTERHIVPTAIVEEFGEWKLRGREAEHVVMLTPDQWHAVQIMLPGCSPS